MQKVIFFNWKRESVMEWSEFMVSKELDIDFVSFETRVSKSIFEAFITVKTNLVSLINFRENIIKLSQQVCSTIIFASSDGVLRVELCNNGLGHIYQKIIITELDSKNYLTINDSFDQTFLPELMKSINETLLFV